MLVEAVECLEDGSVKVLKCLVSTDLDGAGNDQAFKLVTYWPSDQVDDQSVQPGGKSCPLHPYSIFGFSSLFGAYLLILIMHLDMLSEWNKLNSEVSNRFQA